MNICSRINLIQMNYYVIYFLVYRLLGYGGREIRGEQSNRAYTDVVTHSELQCKM